ncbi:MAG: HAMP domain-containing sensor histidine kinase [Cyanobacteria bacterium P01_H01_bin.74]
MTEKPLDDNSAPETGSAAVSKSAEKHGNAEKKCLSALETIAQPALLYNTLSACLVQANRAFYGLTKNPDTETNSGTHPNTGPNTSPNTNDLDAFQTLAADAIAQGLETGMPFKISLNSTVKTPIKTIVQKASPLASSDLIQLMPVQLKDPYVLLVVLPVSYKTPTSQASQELHEQGENTVTAAHQDFISTVSHEFRTPLTSIKGFADTLLRYQSQLPEAEQTRFIQLMKEQADRLIRLVENLLTVSVLKKNQPENFIPRPVLLGSLLERVIASIQAKNQIQPVVSVDLRPKSLEVWADSDKLEQVLLNLVDNAVKYSKHNTPVTVSAHYDTAKQQQVVIQVIDSGIGIPEAMKPKLFEQFFRGQRPLIQTVEGTGLGLYITKTLVELMNGSIAVESIEGQGSTFTVMLPAATPEDHTRYQHRRHL